MADPTPSSTSAASATLAIDSAAQWLLSQLDADGVPRCGPEATYRLPQALVLTGHRDEAAAILTWMEQEILTPDGDLRAGPMRDAFSTGWSTYGLAIIAEAAWRLERYDTAASVVRTLRAFQDAGTGGAIGERPEVRTSSRQDLAPTAQLGITGIVTGTDELADGACRWLTRLWHLQPELPQVLYTATDGTDLITDAGSHPMQRFGLITDFRARRQAFYNPGIAAAFLARYAAVRQDPDAADLAARYLALTVDGGQEQFDHSESVQVCKFGWGAAALLDLTGEQVYAGHVRTMIDWFCAAQKDDGHWDNSPFLTPDGPTDSGAMQVTAEFVQHLAVMATALAGNRHR